MRSVVLLFATALLCACSSSDGGSAGSGPAGSAAVEEACGAQCSALKKCNSTFDDTKCQADCKADAASIGGTVRADFVASFTSCVRASSCDTLKDCDDQAAASIAATAGAQTFCDSYVAKATECKMTADKSKCLEKYKMYTDGTLATAQACSSKTCTEWTTCISNTF